MNCMVPSHEQYNTVLIVCRLQTSSISETNDCVIQDTTKAKWEFRHCTREKFPFVCQRKKGSFHSL